MTKKTEPFSMRLPKDLKAKFKRLADKEHRSLTNLVEKVMIEYVQRTK